METTTAIFCSEHCHSRLTTIAEVETLRGFLSEFFNDVQISIFLRRQDQVALSLYSTRLKSGATDRTILPRTGADDPYFNYDRSLRLWEECFGAINVHVRVFDRARLVRGDVVSDFASAWDLAGSSPYVRVPDQNESIRPVAQEFLRRVNTHLEPIPGLPIEEVRGPLAARLAQLFPGSGARPSRAEAEAFYARFHASNEAVRQRHFPDSPTLFDEDFRGYPETEDREEFGADDIAAVAAALHTAAAREVCRLESEIAIRDAKLHWAREEPVAAERALRRALRWFPGHSEAYRTLAEFMLRLGRIGDAIAAATQAAELKVTSCEYWHFLGALLRRSADFVGAAEAQRRALALEPGYTAARRELDQLQIRLAEVRTPSDAPRPSESNSCPRPLSA